MMGMDMGPMGFGNTIGFTKFITFNPYNGKLSLSNQSPFNQWEFQDPKMETPTIYKAYPPKICPCMVQYLHFRILEFPLIQPRI